MDPAEGFSWFIFGGIALFLLAILLLGRFYPGSGADQVDWRPTRSPEVEAELELDDVDQMLQAQNQRRRRRGADDRTLDEIEAEVMAAQRQKLSRFR